MVNLDPGGRYPTDQSHGRREAWQDPGSARHQHQGSCGQPGGIQQINGCPQKGNFNPSGSCSQPAGSNHYQTSSNGNIHDSYGQSPTSNNDTCSKRQTMNDLHDKQQFNFTNNHMPQANYNYVHPGNSRPNDYLQQANPNHNHGSNSRPNEHVQQANYSYCHSGNPRPNGYMQQANHNHSHASNSKPSNHMHPDNHNHGLSGNPRSNDHNHSKEFGVTSQHSQMPLGTQNTQCGQRNSYGLNNSTNQCSEGNCATQSQHGKNQFGNGREYEQSKNNCGFNSNGQEKYWTKLDKSYCDKNQQISNNQTYPTGLNGSFQNTNKSGQPRNSWSQRRPSGGSYKPDDRTSDCSCCKSAGQLDPPMRRSSSSGPLHQEGSHQRSNFYGSHKDFYQNKSLNTHSNERKNSQEDDFFKLRQTASSHSLYNPCR